MTVISAFPNTASAFLPLIFFVCEGQSGEDDYRWPPDTILYPLFTKAFAMAFPF